MASKDLYAVLGVARNATKDDIRSKYRELARKLHPDVNPDDPAAEARFKEVTAAYAVLSDAKKRQLYDEFGDMALQAGFDEKKAEQLRRFGGGSFDFGDWSQGFFAGGGLEELLGSIMGRRGGGGFRRGPRRGQNLQAELSIDLPRAVRGGTEHLRFDLPGREHVEVKVPAGIKDGQTLRLAGLGSPGSHGGRPGDLLVKVRVLEHPCYRREDDDLHVDVPITLDEAINGGSISFEGPTGEVSVRIRPGTQGGQSLRLRGLGVKGRGNLYVHPRLVAPQLDERAPAETRERLETLVRELGELYEPNVRRTVQF